jgi:hypothetical protein
MEFSYKISEPEYLRAWKLYCKARSGNKLLRTVMFWVFILVCLMLLWGVVEKGTHMPSSSPPAPVSSEAEAGSTAPTPYVRPQQAIWMNVGPLILLGIVWLVILRRFVPNRLRKLYRNDPMMQGTFTVNASPDSLSVRNTAGLESRMVWTLYERWLEDKNLIVVVLRAPSYFVLSLAGLTDFERSELRGILTAALPKK